MHFCTRLKKTVTGSHPITVLVNVYERQLLKIEKTMGKLHEDLQFDYRRDLEALKL